MLSFIQENLIQNNAWFSIVQGLWITVQITAAALVIGTLLAVPVCMLRVSKRRLLSVPAQAYIAFIRGTPVLMLLMLFYYVIFQSSRIDAVVIAIIAFSLNVSGIVAEIMRSAILSVQKPQLDSARAMGMSRLSVFFPRSAAAGQHCGNARVQKRGRQSAAVDLRPWAIFRSQTSPARLTTSARERWSLC